MHLTSLTYCGLKMFEALINAVLLFVVPRD